MTQHDLSQSFRSSTLSHPWGGQATKTFGGLTLRSLLLGEFLIFTYTKSYVNDQSVRGVPRNYDLQYL